MNELGSKFTNLSEESTIVVSMWRICLVTAGGLMSGWISGTIITQTTGIDGHLIKWLPGAIFAISTFIAAWIPGGIASRFRIRRSIVWNFGLLCGITLAYTTAYFAAFYTVLYIEKYVPESLQLVAGGLAGGVIGATVLVNVWVILFPCLTKVTGQVAMICAGALLGTSLALSSTNSSGQDWKPTIWLYVIWQGGMALGLAIADMIWRSEFNNRALIDTDSV